MYKRYSNINIDQTPDNIYFRVNAIYPRIPESEDDFYVITTGGDRYDTLAQQFYQDSSLWWIIASANTSEMASLSVKPGVQLRIPGDKSTVLEIYEQVNKNR